MLATLTIAGATAVAAVGGYAVYRGMSATGASRPVSRGALTAAALFLWTAITLPFALLALSGGIVLALTLIPVAAVLLGGYMLHRRWKQWRNPDVITVS